MSTAAPHPVHASVAFLRIPDFESLSASEQAARKERLEERARAVLAHIVPAERIVLDAEAGLAVVVFGNPSRAMDVALAAQGSPPRMPLQAGLNYGPLALTSRGSDTRVFGDGLSEAATAAGFCAPGAALVTEGFARALQAAEPERAAELVPAGDFTDSRVRMHSFYRPDRARRIRRRRKLAVFGVGGTILILLLGVLGRDIYQPLFQTRPAIVRLEVKPRGEVFVDGNPVGRIPPLTQVEIAPGRHKLTIRSPGVRPYETNLELAPGQKLTIAHTFPAPPPQKPDFWRDLKRRFGS
jgi:hypothetical protein